MSKGKNNKPSEGQSASTLKNLFNRSAQQSVQTQHNSSVKSSGQKMTGEQLKEYMQKLSEQKNGAQSAQSQYEKKEITNTPAQSWNTERTSKEFQRQATQPYGYSDPQIYDEQYEYEDTQGYGEQQYGYQNNSDYSYNSDYNGEQYSYEDADDYSEQQYEEQYQRSVYKQELPDSRIVADDYEKVPSDKKNAVSQYNNQNADSYEPDTNSAGDKNGEEKSDKDETAADKPSDEKNESNNGGFLGRIKAGFGKLINAMKQQPKPDETDDDESDSDDYELAEEQAESADSGIKERYKSNNSTQKREEKAPAKLPKFLSRLTIEEYDDYNEDSGYITDYEDDVISRIFRKNEKPTSKNAVKTESSADQQEAKGSVKKEASESKQISASSEEIDDHATDAGDNLLFTAENTEHGEESEQIFEFAPEKSEEQPGFRTFEFAEPQYQRPMFNNTSFSEPQSSENNKHEEDVKVYHRKSSKNAQSELQYSADQESRVYDVQPPGIKQNNSGYTDDNTSKAQLIYAQDDKNEQEFDENAALSPEQLKNNSNTYISEPAEKQNVPEKPKSASVKPDGFTDRVRPVAIYQSKDDKNEEKNVSISTDHEKEDEQDKDQVTTAHEEIETDVKPDDSRKKRELPAFDIFAEFAKEQKESAKKAAAEKQTAANNTETVQIQKQEPSDNISPEERTGDREFASEMTADTENDVKAESFTDVKFEKPEPVQLDFEPQPIGDYKPAEFHDEKNTESDSESDSTAKENNSDKKSTTDWTPLDPGKKAPSLPIVQTDSISIRENQEREASVQAEIGRSRWDARPRKQGIPLDVNENVFYDSQPEKPVLNERDLTEVGVTTVTYHYPSNEAFIVLAGKFTKTVRGEYEALREFRREAVEKSIKADETPKEEEPQKPEKPEKPAASKTSKSEKNNVSDPVSISGMLKSSEAEVIRNTNDKEKNKKDNKNNKESKDSKESKPTAAGKLRSMFGKPDKKNASQTSGDKNESSAQKNTLEDVIREVEPKVEILPVINDSESKAAGKKAEKRSERQKAAKAKQDKQKIRLSELFTNEEEFDPDDIVMESKSEPKPQLDDYTEESDAESIKTEITTNLQGIFARTIALAATTVASVMLSLIGQCTNLFTDTVRNGWLWFAIISFIIFVISVIVARNPIVNGLLPLRRFKGNSDTAVAVAALAAAMQNIAAIFTPDVFIDGSLFIYTPLVILGLFLNSMGKLLIITRTLYNFNFLVKPFPKFAGKIFTDKENAQAMIADLPVQSAIIGYMCRSKFMSNFLQLSYAPDPSEKLASNIAPWTTVFSLICGIFYGIISQSFTAALSSFALTACMSIPMICLLAVNIPMKRLCSSTLRCGAMITGYETVTQFADTNAIMIDSSQIYPAGSVTLSGMKSFKQSMLNDALLAGAAIMYKVNGTMTHVFENIVQCSRDQLPKVDSVYYEDGMGLSAWIRGQRVLIGNRQILTYHKITPPDIEVEERHRRMGNDVMYISIGGDLIAMFILSYKTTKNVANELHELEQNGVNFIIRTVDPNITRETVADRFGLFHRCITVLPTNLGTVCHGVTSKTLDRSRAYLVTRGKISSFAKAISGCIKMKSNMTISRILQCIGLAIGLATVTMISFVSGFEKLGCLEMLIYISFWSVTTLVASIIRK